MSEQHYAFIKNNRVEEICVFAEKDEVLADRIAIEKGFDDAVWCGEDNPIKHSSYDGKKFTPPTIEYLVEIGVRDAFELLPIEEQIAIMEAQMKATDEATK